MNPEANTPSEMNGDLSKEAPAAKETSQQGTQVNTASQTNPVHLNAPAGAEIELAEIHVNSAPSVLLNAFPH